MADPFADALDAIFLSPMAEDAIYTPAGGEPVAIRVCRDGGTREVSYNGGTILADGNVVQIRRSEIAQPQDGDLITLDEGAFIIRGGATLDVERVTWACALEPA